MKISQILNSKMAPGTEVWEAAQSKLASIPPIAKRHKSGDVPLALVEKLLWMTLEKHDIRMMYIFISYQEEIEYGEIPHYSMAFKQNPKGEHLTTIYGVTIYETFVKAMLWLYSYVRRQQSHG